MSRHLRTVGVSLGAMVMLGTADHAGLRPGPRGFGAARIPVDSMASMYDVDGIPVIQRRVTGGQVVAAQVYLLGGSRQVNPSNAGIEAVMLTASEYGTKQYPGGATRDAETMTGSAVSVGTGPDWTTIGFVGLAEDFDSTWAVVADRLIHPTLDSTAVAIGKRRTLTAITDRTAGPDGMVRQMAESLAYVGHVYQNPTGGTTAAVTSLTPAMVRDYQATQVVGSRLLVVVAGNVTRAQVEGAVHRTLATLPRGTYKWSLPEPWKATTPAIAVKRQQLPTNYLYGIFAGPPASSAEVAALELGLDAIGGESNSFMRDSGLTYGAGASVEIAGATAGVIRVSTGSPDRAMKIFNLWIDRLANANLNPNAFNGMSLGYAGQYLSSMETTERQVEILATSYLYHGDFRFEENFGGQMRQISVTDMQRALRGYLKNIQWAYLGDTAKLPRALMTKY